VSPRRPTDEQVAAQVRARIVAAENRIPVPPDLMQRVTASTPRPEFERPARRWSTMIVAVAAVLGLLCGVAGAVVYFHRDARATMPASTDVAVTVFNAEVPCEPLRTIECSLGVQSDPYRPAPEKVVARVWHGDTVTAICVVADGKRVLDESGVSSTRWYRVRTAKGVIGYLPGVRTRNSVEIQVCPTQR
jgi:hypothetical protein